jgi:hypothetical protein
MSSKIAKRQLRAMMAAPPVRLLARASVTSVLRARLLHGLRRGPAYATRHECASAMPQADGAAGKGREKAAAQRAAAPNASKVGCCAVWRVWLRMRACRRSRALLLRPPSGLLSKPCGVERVGHVHAARWRVRIQRGSRTHAQYFQTRARSRTHARTHAH